METKMKLTQIGWVLALFVLQRAFGMACDFSGSHGRLQWVSPECPSNSSHYSFCTITGANSANCVVQMLSPGAPCDDFIFCNGGNQPPLIITETWNPTLMRCVHDANQPQNPCVGGVTCRASCNETLRACRTSVGIPCSNGLLCDGTDDICDGLGNCVGNLNGDFDTNSRCSTESQCRRTCRDDGTCLNMMGTSCDDGNELNGEDVCDGAGRCVSATALSACQFFPVCQRGFDPVRQQCLAQVGTPCDDGISENGDDFCDGLGQCAMHSQVFTQVDAGLSTSEIIGIAVGLGSFLICLVMGCAAACFVLLARWLGSGEESPEHESLLLRPDNPERAQKYAPFVDWETALLDDNFALIVKISSVLAHSELDKFGKSLFPILQWKVKSTSLLQVLARLEIEETTGISTLFRGNSVFCKFTNIHLRDIGSAYLNSVIAPLINDVLNTQEKSGLTHSFVEVDPAKTTDPEKGKENLTAQCQKFFDEIFVHVNKFPDTIRVLANHIYEETVHKFPEARYIAVGSFLFLRFFGPAIFTPVAYNIKLEREISPLSQRSLVLISKVLQQLANQVSFTTKKEKFMVVMNEFVEDNRPKLGRYLEIAATPYAVEPHPVKISAKRWRKELAALAKLTHDNLSKISDLSTSHREILQNIINAEK